LVGCAMMARSDTQSMYNAIWAGKKPKKLTTQCLAMA
jgi:hypothetical protein